MTGGIKGLSGEKAVMKLSPTFLFGVTAGKANSLTETRHRRKKIIVRGLLNLDLLSLRCPEDTRGDDQDASAHRHAVTKARAQAD